MYASKTHCRKGHLRTEQTSIHRVRGNGMASIECRTCNNSRQRHYFRVSRGLPSIRPVVVKPPKEEKVKPEKVELIKVFKEPRRKCQNCGKPTAANRYFHCTQCATHRDGFDPSSYLGRV